MKTPEERSRLFVEQIIGVATQEFDGSKFDCDHRRGSFQSCVPVTEVRIYDSLASHERNFTPIAILNIVDPENPRFQVKTRKANTVDGVLLEKEYKAGELKQGLVEQLKLAQTGKKEDAWFFLDTAHIKGVPARKVAETA